jgi:NitT/TauT family transport system ATP-binding protein
VIEVRGLAKVFINNRGERVEALQDVSLTIGDNEFLTILGPSGCGKTTLLRAIAGLTRCDQGEITVGGKPVHGPGPERAMVFQSFALLPWATVMKNIAFGLQLQGVKKAEREARARELAELVGLTGFEDRLPGELSGGMQQRVGLARALAVEPDVLLMDEPFGSVDEQTRRLLQEELLGIWERRRITVVFVTHSIEEAVLLGDRVAVMTPRPGRISEFVTVPIDRPRAAQKDTKEGSLVLTEVTHALWSKLKGLQADRQPAPDG